MAKFIKNNNGTLTEESSVSTSAGAGDSGKIVSLNGSGLLDNTILGGVSSSAGAGDASKPVLLSGDGRLDPTTMPSGIGADTASILASENLSGGDLVNIYNNTGTANVRKADGSTAGKESHGFVLSAVTSASLATVYFEGTDTAQSGMTPGVQYLSVTTPGKTQAAAPSGAGQVIQRVGIALSATELNYQMNNPIVLA